MHAPRPPAHRVEVPGWGALLRRGGGGRVATADERLTGGRLAGVTVDLGGVVVLSTAVAYLIHLRRLASAGATDRLLVTFLIPVTAVPLGVLVLREPPLSRHLAGMLLVGMGLLAIDGRAWSRLRRRRSAASDPVEVGDGS